MLNSNPNSNKRNSNSKERNPISTDKKKILFLLTGSIACYKSCQLISKLVQNQFDVQVVASKNALKFVGEATLEGLTGKKVYSELWENGQLMNHIYLNRWADLVVIAPATAHFINKAACGLADDLVSTLYLAHDFKKKMILIPAMNSSMFSHPTTQDSIKKLLSMNIQVIPPDQGSLACGEEGPGRFPDPEVLFNYIQESFIIKNHKRVLITSGGTSEPLDDVRLLTNKSTGNTAASCAQRLLESGFDITFLHSRHSKLPHFECSKKSFESFSDLENLLKEELKTHYDWILHAAAVSDFGISKTSGKISSEGDLTLHLKQNPKLIHQLKDWSINKEVKILGFKMTATKDTELQKNAISQLFNLSKVDWIIHNDKTEFDWDQKNHPYYLWDKGLNKKISFKNVNELAIELSEIMKGKEL